VQGHPWPLPAVFCGRPPGQAASQACDGKKMTPVDEK